MPIPNISTAEVDALVGEYKVIAANLVWYTDGLTENVNEDRKMFGTREVKKILKTHKLKTETVLSLETGKSFEKVLALLYGELDWGSETRQQILENYFENALIELSRELSEKGSEDRVPENILKSKIYMERHYKENLNLEKLAKQSYLSIPHFCSEFKKYFGRSAIDYVIQLRLQEAVYLLSNINLSIKQIAHLVGYEDIYYFSKIFKQATS